MHLISIAATIAICTISSSVLANSFTLSGDARWVALASRQSLDEAIGVAHAYRWRFPTVRVMQATNGWYAIVAGPERIPNPRAYKGALVRVGEIPGDTVITKGQGYVAEVWRPSTFKPLIQAKYDGTKQLNLRSGELALKRHRPHERQGKWAVPRAVWVCDRLARVHDPSQGELERGAER